MCINPFDWLPRWANKDPLSLFDAAALLCDLEPLERAKRNDASATMQLERERIAVMFGRLVTAMDNGRLTGTVPRGQSGGQLVDYGFSREPRRAPIHKYIDARKEIISRADLQAWVGLHEGWRPIVFFGLPDAASETTTTTGTTTTGEMNANRAIAAMALMLVQRGPSSWKRGTRPNVSQIANYVVTIAQELYGEDVKGFEQFRKRLASALKQFPTG
ncbi:MAG: hypothetical protein L0H70_02015 [Xanthomonadales bacterium]|nr:hypothetical protein [Xanthomonadales bacterium]